MKGSRLLIGVASALAGTTVLLGVFGIVYNPILLVAAVPFALATYFIWSHATGRLDERMRQRARYRPGDAKSGPFDGSGGRGPSHRDSRSRPRRGVGARRSPGHDTDRDTAPSAAARVLGVDPDADEAAIRRAFREKARDLHPDAPGGDEAAFMRIRAAYEELTDRP